MSTKLNQFENATVGMTVGIIEVCSLQPLNYAKNMVQQNKPLTFHPTKLYRGLGANCINMGSCTMIQFSFCGAAKKSIQLDPNTKLKPHQEMECGFSAGIISAIIGSPLELIMIQQQNNGGNTIDTVKSIIEKPMNITRGYIGAAIREGLWTCGYLSVPPIIRNELTHSFPDTFDSQAKARIPASLVGGLFSCYLTQPFDVIKTCMQGDIKRVVYDGFIGTALKLYKESNFTGFYRGATWRYGRMVLAIGILDSLQEMVGPIMYPEKFRR